MPPIFGGQTMQIYGKFEGFVYVLGLIDPFLKEITFLPF